MTPLCLIPVIIAAAYLLIVTVCIAGRMDRRTRLWIRLPIIGLAFVSFLVITRMLWGDWRFSSVDMLLAITVLIGAITLARLPRINVGVSHGEDCR